MPIIEFECEACFHKEECIVVSSDFEFDGVCPKCGGKLEKIISCPNYKIKGHSMKNKYGLASNKEYVQQVHKDVGKPIKTNYFE